MAVVLNHTVVAVADKHAGARFLADLLGLRVLPEAGPFVPVEVNGDLVLEFDDRHGATPGHYAFLVDEQTFDALEERLRRDPSIEYGSGLKQGWDRRISRAGEGRGVYIRDPDGHSYEVFTVAPV
ncbi:VOC family protein [Kutzneria sp. NPDC052558]|uniref:VOC family protein n=1 Tax=Kutzneria sp. NPDC052558 TaxID=3364121 RepID=UPI0037C685DA